MTITRYTTLNSAVVSENRGGVLGDYLTDALGSTLSLLNASQTQTNQWSYFPYGESNRLSGISPTPLLFIGSYTCRQDSSAKRVYMLNRVLDSSTAKWLTEDPVGTRASDLNLYRYCSANPTNITDRYGLGCVDGNEGRDYYGPMTGFMVPPNRPCSPFEGISCDKKCAKIRRGKTNKCWVYNNKPICRCCKTVRRVADNQSQGSAPCSARTNYECVQYLCPLAGPGPWKAAGCQTWREGGILYLECWCCIDQKL